MSIFKGRGTLQTSDGGLAKGVGQVLNKPQPAPEPPPKIEPTPATTEIKRIPLPFESKVAGSVKWSEHLRSLFRASKIPDLFLADGDEWHRGYNQMPREMKVELWAHLFGITMKYECDYNPRDYSVDVGTPDDKETWSVGLMQMSVCDQPNYGFKLGYSFEDLQDPYKNTILAVRVAEKLVAQDGLIDGKIDGKWKGLSRYWGTIRDGRQSYAPIKEYVQKLPLTAEIKTGNEVERVVITEPEFVTVEGVRFKDRGHYQTQSGMFSGLTVHYTCSGRAPKNARGVVNWLAEQGYGCMVMDEDGKIYIPEGFDVFRSWGDHSGVSKWNGRSSVSDIFAGMEICCWGLNSSVGPYRESKGEANIIRGRYQQYTEEQEKALVNFILWALTKNPEFKIDNVAGHDELRAEAGKRGDKQDPGASLSMTMPAFRDYLKKLRASYLEFG